MTSYRQLGAIMFTDIVGYTAMMQHDEQKAVSSTQHHEKVLEECVKKHAGKVHHYYGDGSLSIFTSTGEAVRCAIEIQQLFQQDPKLPLRIGIHLGEVRFENGKVFGDGVNIASRMEGLGVAGSVIISEKVRNEIKNQLDISTRFMGIFQLKNVEKPAAVFAIEADGLVIPELRQMQGKAKLISAKERSDEEHPAKRSLIRILAILGAIALILTGIGSYFEIWQKKDRNTKSYSLTPFTTSAWFEGFHSWSPDGNMFTFISLRSGNPDIYIKNRKEGEAIQIVNTPYDEYNARWSPDGSKIAYLSVRDDGTNIYWVPATGGLERKLAETNIPGREQSEWPFYALGTMPWSPDSNELLFSKMRDDGTLAVSVVNILTGQERQLTNPSPGSIDLSASWAPNGKMIVFQRNSKLWIKRLTGEQEEQLLVPDHLVMTPVFSNDGQKVIFTSMGVTGINIWELVLTTRETEQLTFATKWMLDPTPIPNGGLSIDQFSHQVDLIKLDLEHEEEEQLTYHNGNNFYGRFSPDGERIIYQSDRTGNSEIWMINLKEENKEINLTDHPSFDFRPDWSPVEDRIAFFSDRDSVFKVWIMDAEGKNLRKASDTIVKFGLAPWEYIHQLKWSPDGKKIAYLALSEGGNSIWICDPETQSSQPVISNVNSFAWYLNANMIICNRKSAEDKHATDLVVVNVETGEEAVLLSNLPVTELFSSVDGRWLGYSSALGHFSYNLFRLPLSPPADPEGFPTVAGEPEQLTHGGGGKWHVHNGTFSPDSKSALYSRDADQMDIFLIEDYQ